MPCSGRPSISRTDSYVENVKEIVLEKRYISLKDLASDHNISYESVCPILIDHLGIKLNLLQK